MKVEEQETQWKDMNIVLDGIEAATVWFLYRERVFEKQLSERRNEQRTPQSTVCLPSDIVCFVANPSRPTSIGRKADTQASRLWLRNPRPRVLHGSQFKHDISGVKGLGPVALPQRMPC